MSKRLYFDELKQIIVGPVKTRRHTHPDIGMQSVQEIVFHFQDGSRHDMTLNVPAGVRALALGDVVTHDEVMS